MKTSWLQRRTREERDVEEVQTISSILHLMDKNNLSYSNISSHTARKRFIEERQKQDGQQDGAGSGGSHFIHLFHLRPKEETRTSVKPVL